MDVQEAICRAKSYIEEIFTAEDISPPRLEEVEFDELQDAWLVTVSVVRLTPVTKSSGSAALETPSPARTYKLVRIANDGSGVPSVKVRSFAIDDM